MPTLGLWIIPERIKIYVHYTWNILRRKAFGQLNTLIKNEDHVAKIFICYRKEDANDFAKELFSYLNRNKFLVCKVFFDEKLQGGKEFPVEIAREIVNCDVMIAIIGSKWLTVKENQDDILRIAAPDDFVRTEIKWALLLKKKIIPVLVDGAQHLQQSTLPESIRALADIQWISINKTANGYDFKKLKAAIPKWFFIKYATRPVKLVLILAIPCLALMISQQHCTLVRFYAGQPNNKTNDSFPGTAYYVIANKIASYIDSDRFTNFAIDVVTTPGSVENCKKIQNIEAGSGEPKIGLFQLAAYDTGDHCQPNNIAYIAPLYKEVVHFVFRRKLFEDIVKTKKNEKLTLCDLIQEIKDKQISINLQGSVTYHVAKKLIEKCTDFKQGIELGFDETVQDLNSEAGRLAGAFMNQPGKGTNIYNLLENSNQSKLCLFSLDLTTLGEEPFKDLQHTLRLKPYEPQENAAIGSNNDLDAKKRQNDVSSFYRKHKCLHPVQDETTNKMPEITPYKTLYSMSVIAIGSSGNLPDNHEKELVKVLLSKIYNNGRVKDLAADAPEFLDKKSVRELLISDPELKSVGGPIHLHDEAKNFFDLP